MQAAASRRLNPTYDAVAAGQDSAPVHRTVSFASLAGEIAMFGMSNDDSTNALEILKRDHDAVDRLFAEYEDVKESADDSEKESLVAQICDALTVHAQIEETIFYPAARRALQEGKSKDLLDEAAVEHQTLKDIIGRLETAPAGDPLYDAGVKVLSEYVKHHVREEE